MDGPLQEWADRGRAVRFGAAHEPMTSEPSLAELRARFLASGDDANLPIVDPHHHFFDLDRNHHPWLSDAPLASFRYGDYTALRRNFLPADYRRIASGHRIVASVLMEGE